jgi:hypothetical protein
MDFLKKTKIQMRRREDAYVSVEHPINIMRARAPKNMLLFSYVTFLRRLKKNRKMLETSESGITSFSAGSAYALATANYNSFETSNSKYAIPAIVTIFWKKTKSTENTISTS